MENDDEGLDFCPACGMDYDEMTPEQRAKHGVRGEMIVTPCDVADTFAAQSAQPRYAPPIGTSHSDPWSPEDQAQYDTMRTYIAQKFTNLLGPAPGDDPLDRVRFDADDEIWRVAWNGRLFQFQVGSDDDEFSFVCETSQGSVRVTFPVSK